MARSKDPRPPLTLIILSPVLDRLHMALMMGATAAATGRPVQFFFSKNAALFLSDQRSTLKSEQGQLLADYDADLLEKGVADTGVLLDGLNALDVRFLVCETALAEHSLSAADLLQRPSVEVSGLATILHKGAGGDFITF